MTHFLDRKDPFGHRMGLWVLVLMAAALPPAIWSLRGIHLNNDIQNWVPANDPNVLTLHWYHDNFPSSESILMTWEGSTLNDPRINWLADRLEGVRDEQGARHGGLKHVERVLRPQQLIRRIEAEDISQKEAFDRLQGILIGSGPLKVKLTPAGAAEGEATMQALSKEISSKLKMDVSALPAFKVWEPDRPLEEYKLAKHIVEPVAEAPFPAIPAHDGQLRWREMQPRGEITANVREIAQGLKDSQGNQLVEETFFASGSPVAVAVVLSKAGEAEVTESLKEIRAVCSEVGINAGDLHMAGRPVANSELNQAVKRSAWNRAYPIWNLPGRSVILFSGAVGIVLAFWALRSVPLTCFVLFTSYYVVLITVSLVPATGGSMNMVLVVMPTLLFVTTLETSIHLANYWRFAAKTDFRSAVVNAVKMASGPTFLASFMSAIGLASLMTSSLVPVYDFGMYSAVGSMIAFVVVLYGLSSMLGYLPKRAAHGGEEEESSKTWERIAGFLVRKHGVVSATCIATALTCSAGLQWFQTETKAIRYFPESSHVVQDYRFIEENIGGVIPIDIVIRFPKEIQASEDGDLLFADRQEIVRRVQQRLVERHSDISGAVSLATFRPQLSTDELELRRTSGLQRRLDLTTQQKVIQEGSSGRNFVKRAEENVVLEKSGETLSAEGDELWRITAQVNIMTKTDYSMLTADIKEIIGSETKDVGNVRYVVTGMVPLFLETQRAILSSMISSFWIAFVTIWLTMAFVVRNPLAGFIAMIPNALPVSIVFGLVSWFGIAIDIGTMITASVALGISVDGSIHMLAWFQEAVKRGRTRRVAVVEALGHCGPAMCQTGFVVGFGLLVLAPAELTLISRFGMLMAAMVAAALLGTVIWLPALMGGWLGTAVMRQTAVAKPMISSTPELKDDAPVIAGTIAAQPQSQQPAESEPAAGTARPQSVREPHFVKSSINPHATHVDRRAEGQK